MIQFTKGIDNERFYLKKDEFLCIRIDGKNFSKFTKNNCQKPFDTNFQILMIEICAYLLSMVDGSIIAYTQSDEISLIIKYPETEGSAWYGFRRDKLVSITASSASAIFSKEYNQIVLFDSRAFIIPSQKELDIYLNERKRNAYVNGITSLAQSFYSHKELDKKTTAEREQMVKDKGVDLSNYTNFLNGILIDKRLNNDNQ